MRTRWAVLLFVLSAARAIAATPGEKRGVSVLAYNVEFDSKAPQKTLDAISAVDADVLCLTEVTTRFAAQLQKRLGTRYTNSFVRARSSGTWGVAIVSRYPLLDARSFPQAPYRMPAAEARVVTAQGTVRIACLHLFPPGAKRHGGEGFFAAMKENAVLRKQQAEHLVKRYAQERAPVVLLGDFNEEGDGDAVQTFQRAGFQSACGAADAHCGATFPGADSPFPAVFQVDHVLGRHLEFLEARVPHSGGSDHYPLFARFVLEGRAR